MTDILLRREATGFYNIAATSGTLAAALAAGAQLFQFRWTSLVSLAVIVNVRASFRALTPFTAGTLTDFGFDMFKATSISAGGGGTTLGAPSRMRSNQQASLVANINIAATGALTAVTTLDTQAISQSLGWPQRVNVAAGTEEVVNVAPTLVFDQNIGDGAQPLVLQANEGFVISNRVVWPAAGTGLLQVEAHWFEVPTYNT